MKKNMKKKALLTMSVVLLLLVAVGTTLAYIFTKTDPVVNTFTPSKVSCAVVENSGTTVSGGIQNTGDKKSNVQIKNTGDTDAYIRVTVVVNWMNDDGTKVWATKPVEGEDYTISYDLSKGWVDGDDGYYYYTKAVPPTDGNNLTSILIENATQINDGPKGTDGTQYYLSIEIVASAIQSNGMGATSAKDAWTRAQQSANND